jgi:hypothetical protein
MSRHQVGGEKEHGASHIPCAKWVQFCLPSYKCNHGSSEFLCSFVPIPWGEGIRKVCVCQSFMHALARVQTMSMISHRCTQCVSVASRVLPAGHFRCWHGVLYSFGRSVMRCVCDVSGLVKHRNNSKAILSVISARKEFKNRRLI